MPAWLSELGPEVPQQFPLSNILEDSVFYPASAFDGDPVKVLSGAYFSFVYVDYSYGRDRLSAELQQSGFLGYRQLFRRSVSEHELAPNGLAYVVSPTRDELRRTTEMYNQYARADQAFCEWIVFEREALRGPDHGPERFSLLYLLADGAAAYQALFRANATAPAVLALVQPGHAFGRNATNYFETGGLMHRSVTFSSSAYPKYLLVGHIGDENEEDGRPVWPEYQGFVAKTQTTDHTLILWGSD